MEQLVFRDLTAEEIECRPALIKETGLSLLLYKNARVDMDILDETVGAMNWTRAHDRDNANCIVSIWDDRNKMWVSKEDTGTESNTEKEKGLASDSFKRACVNWGIGRELYTSPFIWISAKDCTIKQTPQGKTMCADTFSVAHIEIVNKKITQLSIINDKTGEIVFEWSKQDYDKPIGKEKLEIIKALNVDTTSAKEVLASFGYEKSSDIKVKDFQTIFRRLKGLSD